MIKTDFYFKVLIFVCRILMLIINLPLLIFLLIIFVLDTCFSIPRWLEKTNDFLTNKCFIEFNPDFFLKLLIGNKKHEQYLIVRTKRLHRVIKRHERSKRRKYA